MYELSWEEFQATRVYVEKKALELMDHENKNDTPTGVPIDNYRLFNIDGRTFYSIQINTFKAVVDSFLRQAQTENPDRFGTGNAYDVVEALRLVNPVYPDSESMANFFAKDKCTYVFEAEGGRVVDRILRLDLFRMIKPAKKNGSPEFIGGLLHALKHFSRSSINWSTGISNHELTNIQLFIGEIINAFFTLDGTFETPDQYIVYRPYEDEYNLKFAFYREAKTGVFFLNTVYKEPKDKQKEG